ncbi:MAG TPA: ATPase, T2SS/T4P/T4SS family [Polyangiales bacterium]|jgi:twitching motility protein PilT|nr:ATPase, T2SS/T4P/T4SS family [Polyangiales bacterium]
MPELATYFEKLRSKDAGELLLAADRAPLYRSDRALAPLPGEAPTSDATLRAMLSGMLSEAQWEAFGNQGWLRFSLDHAEHTRVTGCCVETQRGISATLRLLPLHPPSGEVLGLPPDALSCSELDSGLVLVAGPMRSGKTTTLAALVDHALGLRARHVVTVEDPIELMHAATRRSVSHRQVGVHCTSFGAGIEAAMRADAELIVVSELDAPEALQAALQAADSGVLVLGAVRASTAERALGLLLDAESSDTRGRTRLKLYRVLRAAIEQRLTATPDGVRTLHLEVFSPEQLA